MQFYILSTSLRPQHCAFAWPGIAERVLLLRLEALQERPLGIQP